MRKNKTRIIREHFYYCFEVVDLNNITILYSFSFFKNIWVLAQNVDYNYGKSSNSKFEVGCLLYYSFSYLSLSLIFIFIYIYINERKSVFCNLNLLRFCCSLQAIMLLENHGFCLLWSMSIHLQFKVEIIDIPKSCLWPNYSEQG